MKPFVKVSLLLLAAVIFAAVFELQTATAQNRDRFLHSTPEHRRKDCNSCHAMPTGNWVSARGYPDVADYPAHVACFSCHRRDIFSGNQPVFCGGCHTVVGPRGKARFPFPVRTRSQEFLTIFPHNVHQDIIASREPPQRDIAVAHFVNASWSPAPVDEAPKFNNCAICHETLEKLPKVEPRKLLLGGEPLSGILADTFKPGKEVTAAFFKDSPNNHASCFTCHYQGIKPVASDCKGCHTLTKPYFESSLLTRYSLKFNHNETTVKETEVEKDGVKQIVKEESFPHGKDCMTCHLRIAQNDDITKMKNADVPFLACASCHAEHLNPELDARFKDKAFQCTYCHTSAIGRFPVPPSHEIR